MDWFERLTGFREMSYDETCARLAVTDGRLHSRVNGASYDTGTLELVPLAELRQRADRVGLPGRLTVRIVTGDVRRLHGRPIHRGALFQVASQFNLLEMVGPGISPEDGVTRYEDDKTQGPACAIAAGAATIYRNYFAPVGDALGQTSTRQLDGLGDVGRSLAQQLGTPVESLWTMQNGYALASPEGLRAIAGLLAEARPPAIDALRGLLRIGLHSDVEVTDGAPAAMQRVSQAFCSALPVAYSHIDDRLWEPFARLVLEAAYEATLCAATLNAARGASNQVLLTQLGGGAFGNAEAWIDTSLRRALDLMRNRSLDVILVSYGEPSHGLASLARDYAERPAP